MAILAEKWSKANILLTYLLKLPVHMYVPGSSVINWKLIIIKLACSYDNQRTSLIGRFGL